MIEFKYLKRVFNKEIVVIYKVVEKLSCTSYKLEAIYRSHNLIHPEIGFTFIYNLGMKNDYIDDVKIKCDDDLMIELL